MNHEKFEETQTCNWPRCKEQIIVEQYKDSVFHVVGWCEFHQKVYGKEQELFHNLGLDSNKVYMTDRKKFREIQKQAIKIVKQEMKIAKS